MTSTLLAKTLLRADHIRSFQILVAPSAGWDATAQSDRSVVEQHHCADWHRVERVLAQFSREIDKLREEGWREA